MNSVTEKIQELIHDSDFVESLLNMEDNTDVQKAFAERGVDLSLDQIDSIAEMAFGANDELDETQLETVAGGGLEEIGVIIDGIKTIFGWLTEINNSRKAKKKKPIW